MSTQDVANAFGVSKNTVHVWRRRYTDFPNPVAIVAPYVFIYDSDQVRAWHTDHSKDFKQFGRPKGGRTSHIVKVHRLNSDAGVRYQAACSTCDWRGDERASEGVARRDASKHRREAVTA